MNIIQDYFLNVIQVNYDEFMLGLNNPNDIVINTMNLSSQLSDPFNPARYVFYKSNILGEPEFPLTFKQVNDLLIHLLIGNNIPFGFTKEDFSSQNIWRYGLENLSIHINSNPIDISETNRHFIMNMINDLKLTLKKDYFLERLEKNLKLNKINSIDYELNAYQGNYVKGKINIGMENFPFLLSSDDNKNVFVNFVNNSNKLIIKDINEVRNFLKNIEVFEVLANYEYR